MSSTKTDDARSPLLGPYPLANRKIHFVSYAGNGRAGYVFKVRIRDNQSPYVYKTYAYKMFKFDNPELNPSLRLTGSRRRAVYDYFFIECRANGSLIRQGLNGRITPFCYGWLDVPTTVEQHLNRKFHIPLFAWERSAANCSQNIRGILYEWIDGEPLSQIRINSDIVAQVRAKVKALHDVDIVHGDLAASNVLVQGQGEKRQAHLLDLSASTTLPHMISSAQAVALMKQEEMKLLEHGFFLLSKLPINNGVSTDDLSCGSTFDENLTVFLKDLWAPPRATCHQEPI